MIFGVSFLLVVVVVLAAAPIDARPGAVTLDAARGRVGDGVVYCPPGGRREDGVITSVGSAFVFVRYSGDTVSKATRPQDLEWLS